MKKPKSLSSEEIRPEARPQYQVEPGSKLDCTLLGLDPEFALSRLPARHRQTLELRFGLLDGELKTQQHTSEILNVGRSRVSDIEARAIARMTNLRALFRPEKAFYLEKSIYYPEKNYDTSDRASRWKPYPNRFIHSTWEDTEPPDWS
jgi:hypothetical protein